MLTENPPHNTPHRLKPLKSSMNSSKDGYIFLFYNLVPLLGNLSILVYNVCVCATQCKCLYNMLMSSISRFNSQISCTFPKPIYLMPKRQTMQRTRPSSLNSNMPLQINAHPLSRPIFTSPHKASPNLRPTLLASSGALCSLLLT